MEVARTCPCLWDVSSVELSRLILIGARVLLWYHMNSYDIPNLSFSMELVIFCVPLQSASC